VDSRFRPAGEGDLDVLVELQAAFHAEEGIAADRPAFRSASGRLLRDGSLGRAWLIGERGAVVGYLLLTFGYSVEHGGRDAYVDELNLVPGHRGRGIGRKALRLAEDACREAGIRMLLLEVGDANEPAAALYRRAGFHDRGRRLMNKVVSPD
jgi:ribosomal protein S18 acetylase RimI-like enzyme